MTALSVRVYAFSNTAQCYVIRAQNAFDNIMPNDVDCTNYEVNLTACFNESKPKLYWLLSRSWSIARSRKSTLLTTAVDVVFVRKWQLSVDNESGCLSFHVFPRCLYQLDNQAMKSHYNIELLVQLPLQICRRREMFIRRHIHSETALSEAATKNAR